MIYNQRSNGNHIHVCPCKNKPTVQKGLIIRGPYTCVFNENVKALGRFHRLWPPAFLSLCTPEFVRYITYSPDLLPRNFKCSYFYHNYELTNENYNNSIRHSVISNICTNDAPRFIQCQLRLNKFSTLVHFLSI